MSYLTRKRLEEIIWDRNSNSLHKSSHESCIHDLPRKKTLCNKIANWLEDPWPFSLSKFSNLKRNQLSITPRGKKQATI